MLSCLQQNDKIVDATSILLVEDNPGDAGLLQLGLHRVGRGAFSVRVAVDLERAILQLEGSSYDVVLLDLSLPDSYGIDTLEAVVGATSEIPIIVLTGNDDEAMGLRAVHAGAEDYLVKGKIDDASLIRSIRFSIERHLILSRMREFDLFKSQFLATASHEMRTPLTVIREFSSLLHDGVCGAVTADQQDGLQVVLRNCDRLAELLDDLLDLKRIQSGHCAQKRDKCDLADLVKECQKDFTPKCKSRAQSITLELPESLPFALADSFQISQVLVNLVGNACKFTPDSGNIVLRILLDSDLLTVEVQDNGRGIPSGSLATIFEAFSQVERSDVSVAKGSGLGLAISQEIIRGHGGEIGVSSPTTGGSIFFFSLPVWSEKAAFVCQVEKYLNEPGRAAGSMMIFKPLLGDNLQMLKESLQKSLRTEDQLIVSESRGHIALFEVGNEEACKVLVNRLVIDGTPCEWATIHVGKEATAAKLLKEIDNAELTFRALSDMAP